MKKIFILSAALLAGLVACQKTVENPEEVVTPSRTYTLTVKASKGDLTKALELAQDEKTILATWAADERVAVVDYNSHEIVGELLPETAGDYVTNLKGTLSVEAAVDQQYYLLYPSPKASGALLNEDCPYTGQHGDLEELAALYDYATCGMEIASIDDSGVIEGKPVTFYNRQAIVRLTLLDENQKPLEANQLILSTPDARIAQSFWFDNQADFVWGSELEVTPVEANDVFYVALLISGVGEEKATDITVTARTEGGLYSKTIPGDKVYFNDGYFYRVNLNMVPEVHTYTVAGNNAAVFGTEWDPTNTDNDMIGMYGTYNKIYTNVPAGELAFKVCEDHAWDNSWGGDNDSDYILDIESDGATVAISFDALTHTIYTEVTYPEPQDTWYVVGSFNDWSPTSGVAMTLTEGLWVSPEIELPAACLFKILLNKTWDVNRGAEYDGNPFPAAVNQPFAVVNGGANIKVPGAGKFVVTYDPEQETILLTGEYTEPQDPPAEAWSVIGSMTGWSTDLAMTEVSDNVWKYAGLTLTDTDLFKLRNNGKWDENLGGVTDNPGDPYTPTVGVAFAGVQDGGNIVVGIAGTYDITLDRKDNTILIEESTVTPKVLSIIGHLNGTAWDYDWDMVETETDLWEYQGLEALEGDEFKIRLNHDWTTTYGSYNSNGYSTIDPDYPYEVFTPTSGEAFWCGESFNIRIPATGTYNVQLDLITEHITIELQGGVEPEPEPVDVALYFGLVDIDWATPHLWAWGPQGNYFAEWPGVAMEEAETINNIKYYKYVVSVSPDNIWGVEIGLIVNSGTGSQTADYKVTLPANTTEAWFDVYSANGITLLDGKPEEQAAADAITIDGSFDDWEGITEFAGDKNRFDGWRVTSDANNIYIYYRINKGKIKSDGSSKIYIGFDLDNDATTGDQGENGAAGNNGGLEALAYVYPWTASLDVNTGVIDGSYVNIFNGDYHSDAIELNGKIEGNYAYLELKIARSDLGSPASGSTIVINSAMQYYPTGRETVVLN